MSEATSPDDNAECTVTEQLDNLAAEHGIVPRNPGEANDAYSERLIDAIDGMVQNLWNLQDVICTLLINSVSE